MALTGEQRRALRLLAGSPLGATEAIMLAHDFTNAMPDDGRTAGNEGGAAAERGDMADITEVGRQALRRRQCAASSNLKETGALDDAPAAFAC